MMGKGGMNMRMGKQMGDKQMGAQVKKGSDDMMGKGDIKMMGKGMDVEYMIRMMLNKKIYMLHKKDQIANLLDPQEKGIFSKYSKEDQFRHMTSPVNQTTCEHLSDYLRQSDGAMVKNKRCTFYEEYGETTSWYLMDE